MKKLIPKLIFIVLIVAVVFGGKYVIDHKTHDYRTDVKKSLTDYFINGNVSSLDSIVDLLNEYVDDEEYRKNVQTYSADIVGSWFVYIDNKYYCSTSNKNSCTAQHAELTTLSNKLEELYKVKADDGYTIIVPSSYNSLKKQTEEKLAGLNRAMTSTTARDPQDIEQIRQRKCQLTNECERCYEGACTCYYTDSSTKVREELQCWGKAQKN
ncbi:MAG: hypothetical protein E7171_04840 [Firmicutes bacterium]|nr:hypothetical protein [Bacillota bacterium]